jgi:hypothetical protein
MSLYGKKTSHNWCILILALEQGIEAVQSVDAFHQTLAGGPVSQKIPPALTCISWFGAISLILRR